MTEPRLPGERLREERIRQGLSEDDVSARLRLSRSYLRALESDDYERLPQAAFVRGYIRNYARLLELPGEELIGEYQHLVGEQPSEPGEPEPSGTTGEQEGMPPWAWPAGAVALLLVVLVLWLGGERGEQPAVPEQEVANADGNDVEDAAEEAELTDTDPLQVPEDMPADAADAEEEVSEEVAQVAEPAPAPDELRMRFGDECWLEVHEVDSGERIHRGRQEADSELNLAGQGPFRVTLGNAPALEALEFNGEVQELPGHGRPGQVIRITVP